VAFAAWLVAHTVNIDPAAVISWTILAEAGRRGAAIVGAGIGIAAVTIELATISDRCVATGVGLTLVCRADVAVIALRRVDAAVGDGRRLALVVLTAVGGAGVTIVALGIAAATARYDDPLADGVYAGLAGTRIAVIALGVAAAT
jgi:hypothetical protein